MHGGFERLTNGRDQVGNVHCYLHILITVDVTPEAKEPKEPKQGGGGGANIRGHLLQFLNRRPPKQDLVEKGIYKGLRNTKKNPTQW